jgi:hypothetical protein
MTWKGRKYTPLGTTAYCVTVSSVYPGGEIMADGNDLTGLYNSLEDAALQGESSEQHDSP